jgi:hypothetical protein
MAVIAISTAGQKNEFLSRLARIEAGTGSSKSTLFVGLDETILVNNKANAKLKKQAVAAPQKKLGPMEILFWVVMGLVAFALARYLRFYFGGDGYPLANPDMEMALNGGTGLIIVLFTGFMLKMPMLKIIPISGLGVMAGVVAFHNLVHFYPTKFAEVFSPLWVEHVVATTDPHSIIWRGVSFVL